MRARRHMMTADEILGATSHRPWPTPEKPWAMRQVWSDLLFAHWPTNPNGLAALLPAGLTPDTWEGDAWVAVAPFRMPYLSIRRLPDVPPFMRLLETNVRTYVTVGGKPGVYFFSLDADNPVTVEVARRWYSLPYFNARFDCDFSGAHIRYRVARADQRAAPGAFAASYRPTTAPRHPEPGSLEDWLTARYALYTTNKRGQILRGEITHAPWSLAPAEAEIRENTLAQSHGIALADTAPLLHFAERLDVLAWPVEHAK
ncbi:MAG TPA: DUF2071 domain-containing protein [Ktedonobacterales bacterium]|nr:DUF2071 domain-containing protein [Ktedonobacterales bacterium]